MDERIEKLIDISNRAKRRDRRCKGRIASGFGLHAARVHDLESLLAARYGAELSNDDAGIEDFEILTSHVLGLRGDAMRNLKRYAARWCPWMTEAEVEAVKLRMVGELPLSAAELGKLVRLTAAERLELHITTIRPFDKSAQQLERERRERQNAKRRKINRADFKAEAAAKIEAQKVAGVSRATWYRMKAKEKAKNIG